MVISIVTTGRKVHRVLVDQGSSADVMFLLTFNKLQLPPDLLRPYTGCLYGFANNPVEVRGYLELRTTFTDGAASRTESIRYLVVNANSAYNILLGRPALNRLRAVSSTRHMKMKLPDLSGKVIVIKSDQEETRKCYENSLTTKRGMLMVIERPLVSDSQMELEPLEEAMPAKSTLVEAYRRCTYRRKKRRCLTDGRSIRRGLAHRKRARGGDARCICWGDAYGRGLHE